jgi:hypothetical protein
MVTVEYIVIREKETEFGTRSINMLASDVAMVRTGGQFSAILSSRISIWRRSR